MHVQLKHAHTMKDVTLKDGTLHALSAVSTSGEAATHFRSCSVYMNLKGLNTTGPHPLPDCAHAYAP